MAYDSTLPSMSQTNFNTAFASIRENFRAIVNGEVVFTRLGAGRIPPDLSGGGLIPVFDGYSTTTDPILNLRSTVASSSTSVRFGNDGGEDRALLFLGGSTNSSGGNCFNIFHRLNSHIQFFTNSTKKVMILGAGDVILNATGSALATNSTAGFVHIANCAGAPTGVPANTAAGASPMVYDTTNNRLYVYNGSWKSVLLA